MQFLGPVVLEGYRIHHSRLYFADSQQFELTEFDDISFCFFVPSAETHLLDPFLSLVLDICAKSPVTSSGLSKKTADLLDVDLDESWCEKNDRALKKLISMRIIQNK